ncbi:MAG: polysaccharide deacetylase family protein [Candidatus Omnitrophica bacterium]|nr:polysaccharide deacetylase family protein [Candidatus Omnitrophota bacterium]
MPLRFRLLLILFVSFAVVGRHGHTLEPSGKATDYERLKKEIVSDFSQSHPHEWGETVSGVKTRLDTEERVIALTFDACGSKGDGYDSALIDYLIRENVPATLFMNARWIDKNPETFKKLAGNDLFEIENHGMEHKPCSVNGKSVYGIDGTKSPAEVVDEIEKNARKIEALTGRRPKYYRSGTAYYDEVAVKIAGTLGYEVVGFSVLGDRGASYSEEEVKNAFLSAGPGSIIIAHMNHPEKDTAEGVMAAIPELKRRGFIFVKLDGYGLK